MRILVVNNFLPVPPMDGSKLRRLQQLAALAREHEVWVLGRSVDEDSTTAFEREHPELRVVRVPEAGEAGRSLVARAVREVASSEPIGCVHVSGFPQWPGPRAFGNARVVLDVDSVEAVVLRRMRATGSSAVSTFDVAATESLQRLACERADLVLACSTVDAALLRELAPTARIHVAPNGVDTAFFDAVPVLPVHAATPPLVTFTGLLTYWPNADACAYFVEEILPGLEACVGRVRFRMVGRVPPANVVALTARPDVELIADVPDIRPYFAAADVMVVPLRTGSGTRLKILEAFAARRPVVSTTIGCEGLDVESGRHLLIADTPAAFAEAVANVLQVPGLRARLCAEAYELVCRRYDVAVLGEELRSVYRTLMAGPSALAGVGTASAAGSEP